MGIESREYGNEGRDGGGKGKESEGVRCPTLKGFLSWFYRATFIKGDCPLSWGSEGREKRGKRVEPGGERNREKGVRKREEITVQSGEGKGERVSRGNGKEIGKGGRKYTLILG